MKFPIEAVPIGGGRPKGASEALADVKSGKRSIVQWVDECLMAIEAQAPLSAFVHVDSGGARRAAMDADDLTVAERASRALHGVPIAIKDNIDVAGHPTSAGSPALTGHVPRRHAAAVERLIAAGAIVVGKTNLHEFALGITSNNKAFGPVRNPYAPDHIAGGSSGGSACAVAMQMAPVALGTDTGGSIRIPAALCGVVGFRPSVGRWPTVGVVPISSTRDTVGPIARSVTDCALLDAVVCDEPLAVTKAGLDGLRIGVPRSLFWGNLETSVSDAGELVLNKMRNGGATLVPCDFDVNDEHLTHAGNVIAMAENLAGLRDYFAGHGLPFDAHRIAKAVASSDVRAVFKRMLSASAPSAADHLRALEMRRSVLQTAYASCFFNQKIDAIVFPTTPLPAARIGEDELVELNGLMVRTFEIYTRNATSASVIGIPGISLPMGLSPLGLPLGIELDGPAGTDRRLLSIAMALEHLLTALPTPKGATPNGAAAALRTPGAAG